MSFHNFGAIEYPFFAWRSVAGTLLIYNRRVKVVFRVEFFPNYQDVLWFLVSLSGETEWSVFVGAVLAEQPR
jgi:hypothetical protein